MGERWHRPGWPYQGVIVGVAVVLALTVLGSCGQNDSYRRENMVTDCVRNGGRPVECSMAAERTIPFDRSKAS